MVRRKDALAGAAPAPPPNHASSTAFAGSIVVAGRPSLRRIDIRPPETITAANRDGSASLAGSRARARVSASSSGAPSASGSGRCLWIGCLSARRPIWGSPAAADDLGPGRHRARSAAASSSAPAPLLVECRQATLVRPGSAERSVVDAPHAGGVRLRPGGGGGGGNELEAEEEEPLREWWGASVDREDIDMLEALNRDLQPDYLEKKRIMLKPERGFGALFELEGVIVDTMELQRDSWMRLAEEEQGKGQSYVFAGHARQMERMMIMRNEQFIFEVLDWSGDPIEIMRLVARKEEIFRELLKERGLPLIPGAKHMLQILKDSEVPCAVGSLQPRESVEAIIAATELGSYFKALVSGADFLRLKPSPQMYLTMAKEVERAPMFCCVFDHSPTGIEAARAGQMKCVVVSSKFPPYALTGADVIVDRLDELSVLLFKRIFVY